MMDIGIDLHLMTRGYSRDYRFISKRQAVERWWNKYANWARFEAPTIIVETGRFYISGIPSACRRDSVGTSIRYALAGDVRTVGRGRDSKGVEIALNLLGNVTKELERNINFAELAKSFDEIDKELIEKALADDEGARDNVLAEIGRLLKTLPDAGPCALVSERQWCSGPTRDGFLAMVATAQSLLNGTEPDGLVAYLNLAEEGDASSFLDRGLVGLVFKVGPRR